MPGVILADSALCAAGRGTEQLWASVRASLSRIASSHVMGGRSEPLAMGLVPDDALEPELPPEIDALPFTSRARRMLRLGAPVLRSVAEHVGTTPVRLFLGLPELAVSQAPWLRGFALYLGKVAGILIDAQNSRVVPSGRAAALTALELALAALDHDPQRPVLVGGVDTYLDLGLLASLETEGRLLGGRVSDGFIPGEGAAFLVLVHPSRCEPAAGRLVVQAAATCADAGHRSGLAPARGEGLAEALELLRSRLADGGTRVNTTFAAMNGESFYAKQWGVARLRHTDFFAPDMIMEHPADCFGDAGAALGALLLAIAGRAISGAQRSAPALVWAASDGESRACALLSRA